MKTLKISLKAILLFGTILFLNFEINAQFVRITYPIDRMIFQQKFGENTPISLSFQIDMLRFTQETALSGGMPIYKVEKIDLKTGTTVLSTPRNWAFLSSFSNWSLPTLDFKGFLVNDLALEKGWYRVTAGVYYSDPSGNFIAPLTSIVFGVGDVYFVAGQSNASGFDESGDNVVNYSQTYPSTEQYDCVSNIFSPLSEDGVPNSYGDINILGLPFNPRPNPSSALLPSNPVLNNSKNGSITNPQYIYPNGRGSWYWTQFAYRMAKDKSTPTMIFNVATPDKSMSDWASSFNTNPYKQLHRTLQTYGSILGAKAILWHQGENDTKDLRTTSNQNTYLSTYTSRLNNMIGWSRADVTMSSDPNILKQLSWYVSKASFHYAGSGWTVSNPTTDPHDPIISSLICNENTRTDITQKMVSNILKTAQTNNPTNNIFEGVSSDDIGECDRASTQRIHFTGGGTNRSLEEMGNRWFDAVNTNYSQSSVESQQLLSINVELDGSNNYALKGPRKAGNVAYAKYFWVKNGDGVFEVSKVLSTSVDFSTNQNFSTLPIFYVCYVSDDTDPNNFKLRASQPFVMKNTRDSDPNSQQLRITNGSNTISAISFSSNTELKDIIVESDNLIWDADNIPSWVTLSSTNGGFQNTQINITTQPNSGALRQHIMKVKKLGSTSDFEQFLQMTQLANSCSDVNLSSLSPINPSNEWSGFGSLQLNKSISGNTMAIGNLTFINGLGTHANSTIKYNLAGNYTALQAFIGRDNGADGCTLCGSGQTVIFKIKAENQLIYTSPPMGVATSAIQINVDVSGKNELELIVEDGGDNTFGDHANWADAKLVCVSPCVNNLVLQSHVDDIGGSQTKRANQSINATNKVFNNGQTEYKAGNYILLQAGFKAENTVFKANITLNPCFDNN